VPDAYVKATVSESVEERLPSITSEILSRSRLERIILEMDLYKAERSRAVMEDVVQTMRDDITTSADRRQVDSFRVSYVGDSAETARKVTERLTSLYIEQNLRDRESQADNTSQFLSTQVEEAKRRLVEQEKKLEVYRNRHAGQLPSQLQGNMQAIQNASLQLSSLSEATNRASERRMLIERQIADSQAIPLPQAAPLPPDSSEMPPTASTAQRLELARGRLNSLLQRYTPNHPEVVSLQRTVEELAIQLESETPTGATQAPPEKRLTPAEAGQQKKILDLKAELAVLDHQLAANRKEEARLKATIASYQGKVDILPTRESELVELTRDYNTLQTAYTTLLMKREDAAIAANLERRQIGEQFKVLDPASLPEKASNQMQRVAVMMSGAAAGLVLGLLVLALREYRDSSFRGEDEVFNALSLPVLALIPVLSSERERLAAKRRGRIIDLAGTTALLAAGAVLVFWHLQS
jgi:polysaccharide chain length determinant protein (PEP-CTERM system associated)